MAGPAAKPAPDPAPVPAREVFVVAPDGGTYAMPMAEAADAIRSLGARLETPEERRTREVEARQEGKWFLAGVEGALRGATFGLSDVAGALGGQAEGMAERREAFPTVSTVSEIGGGLLGLGKGAGAAKTTIGKGVAAVSAPARAVTRAGVVVEKSAQKLLAPLAERGIAGKMAARGLSVGAGAGVEGAMVGAQQWLTESVLGEAEPTAEALLDHIGVGAMFGGLLGGGLGGLGEGAAAGLTRAGKALRGALPEGKALEDGLTDLWAKGAHAATGVDEDAARAVIKGRDAIPAAEAAPERIGRELAEKLDEFSELSDDITVNHRGPKTQKGVPAVEAEVNLDDLQEALLGPADRAGAGMSEAESALLNIPSDDLDSGFKTVAEIPDGWWVSGRGGTQELQDDRGFVTMATRDWETAKQYRGKEGSIFALSPAPGAKVLDVSEAAGREKIFDKLVDDFNNDRLPQQIADLLDEENPISTLKKISDEFNPRDIVDSGEALDNPDLVQWLWDSMGVDAVVTDNGFAALNLAAMKKLKVGSGSASAPVATKTGVLGRIRAMVDNAKSKEGRKAYAGHGQIKKLSDTLDDVTAKISSGKLSKAQIIDAVDGLKRKTGALRKQYTRASQKTPDVISSMELFDEVYRLEKDLLEDPAVTGKTFAALQTDVNKHFAKDLELSHAQAASGMVKAHGERGFLDPEAALRGEVVWRYDPAAMETFARNLGENPNAATLPLEIVEGRATRRLETMEAISRHYDLGPQGMQKLERARTLVKEIRGSLEEAKAAGVLRRQLGDAFRASRGTGINVGSGAIAGGFLGGPIGAAAGAVVGALFDPVRAAQQLSTVQRLLGAQRLDVVRKVGSYVRGATAGAKKAARHAPQALTRAKAAETRKARVQAYRRQLSGMSRALSDPEAAQRELMNAVSGIDYAAPRAAQAMQAKAVRVAGYLHDRMAKPMRPPAPFAKSDGWEPSDTEIARAESLARVAMRPSALLDDLKDGTITGEQVDAVRELHPHVYQQIVDELTDRLSSLSDDLPYDERVRLTVLFGVPIEPSASPEALATWQETHAATRAGAAAEAQQQRPMTAATAKSMDRVAEASMTPTQRLEAKA